MRAAPWVLVIAACSSGGGPAPAPVAHDAAPVSHDAAELDDAAPAPDDADPSTPEAHLRAGREASQQKQWAKALAELELAARGGDTTALAELAFAAVLAGDARKAAAAAQAVIDQGGADDPARATAYYHLGRAAELRGDLAAARAAYEASLALRDSTSIADRLAGLTNARRRGPPPPAAPPCNRPQPAAELCGCLGTSLALDGARCVISHQYKLSKHTYAVTVVARAQAPTFLVTTPAKGQLQVLARLGTPPASAPDAELTITRWTFSPGPDGAEVVRVDARLDQRDAGGKARPLREDAVLCVVGASARCLATIPLMERVGTPSAVRHLALDLDADGVAHVTVTDGPSSPATLLGSHRLW